MCLQALIPGKYTKVSWQIYKIFLNYNQLFLLLSMIFKKNIKQPLNLLF